MAIENNNRLDLKQEFLSKNNIKPSKIIQFPQDASFRSYERLIMPNNSSYILMDAPPEKEKIEPFIKVAKILLSFELSAPEIYADDIKNGFLLLEDFGDDSFNKCIIKNPEKEASLYFNATDVLIHLMRQDCSHLDLPAYDYDKFMNEASIFADYCLTGFARDSYELKDLYEEYLGILNELYDLLPKNHSPVLVLRDYHVDNLHLLEKKSGIKTVGLLDFQDAVVGSNVYDIASLLEDARKDVSPYLVHEIISYFVKNSGVDAEEFMYSYYIWAMQRNLKIIGVFNRKFFRDKNDSYLRFLPRVWGNLLGDLTHLHLEKMKDFLIKCTTKMDDSI